MLVFDRGCVFIAVDLAAGRECGDLPLPSSRKVLLISGRLVATAIGADARRRSRRRARDADRSHQMISGAYIGFPSSCRDVAGRALRGVDFNQPCAAHERLASITVAVAAYKDGSEASGEYEHYERQRSGPLAAARARTPHVREARPGAWGA